MGRRFELGGSKAWAARRIEQSGPGWIPMARAGARLKQESAAFVPFGYLDWQADSVAASVHTHTAVIVTDADTQSVQCGHT